MPSSWLSDLARTDLPENGRPHMAISVGHTMRVRVTGSKASGPSRRPNLGRQPQAQLRATARLVGSAPIPAVGHGLRYSMSMTALVQIVAATMAPDASWAATVAADGTVQTWGTGVAPRMIRRAVAIGAGQPVAVALSGNRLRVLWAAEGTIRLHEDVEGGRHRDDVFPAPERIRALALSPSGGLAVVACEDGTLRSLDAGTGELGLTLVTGPQTARAVAVASDHGPVVAAFPDGSVRRYDLATGTSGIVGISPGIHLIAVTPDGGAVIAAGTDGVLLRWKPSLSSPPDLRTLGTAVTAIATDGTGDKVLASMTAGGLWLHDFTGGPAIELGTPAAVGAGTTSSAAPPATASPPQGDFRGIVDNDVRFTVYRPQALSPGIWASLLVFAHKTDLIIPSGGQTPVDPSKQVEDIARDYFRDVPVRQASEDARSEVFRGARLRIAPDLPGIQCDPGEAEFDWQKPVHQVVFRILAEPDRVGSVVRGAVRVWCGPLLLGEVSLAISITASTPGVGSAAVAESAPRYRKIFPSYSHDDRAIVDDCAEVARALGDQYLQDVLALRSGERWRARLPELIDEADIFQLFWSSNSMRSQYCREEWEHALALGRPLFVRPMYWEDPLPQDPAMELPPVALRELQFVKYRPYPTRSGTPASSEKVQDTSPGLSAPTDASPAYAPPPPGPERLDAQPPPQGPPGQSRPPGQGPYGRPPASSRGGRRSLVQAIAAAGVVVLYLAVATVSHTFPFAKSHPIAAPLPSAKPTHATPSPTGPALAAGVTPLTQLLPSDIYDPATQCTLMTPPFPWNMPGLVQALSCTDPGLPQGQVYAFQMNSFANFETSWQNFNKWWPFDNSTAGTSCPPPSGGHGIVSWNDKFFPSRTGQVLECQEVGSSVGSSPAYAWAYPTEAAFIVAQGAPGSSFSALDSWWTNNAEPLNSPSPKAP